ncbi:hypothetical protein BDV12DRAFT_209033 [Aspergillus spectabilis]
MTSEGKRKRRSKVACEPCRTRKRKCDGQHPCDTCRDFDYPCSYDLEARKETEQQAGSRSEQVTPGQVDESPTDTVKQSVGSNSGAVFVRSLGINIDSDNASDPRIFAWNIGSRQLAGSFVAMPVVDIISAKEMSALAPVYFDKVAPYYDYIDRDSLFENLQSRWNQPSVFEPFDVVLCGVAAMAYLFSSKKAVATKLHLVESLRSSLEQCSVGGIPPVIGSRDGPCAWLASCSLMHLIDTSGLHLDPSSRHIRRRLVSFARYINTWVSFDLARSRVILQGASYATPSSPEGDFTAEMLGLLPLSESLDVYTPIDAAELTAVLVNIMESSRTEPPSVLSQCNLVLCIFRRLRAVHTSLSAVLMGQMLALITKALAGARELVDANCPWAHVANVPFQIICTLLAVESPESLSLLDDAVQTLKYVADTYDTEILREAYRTSGSLILFQQRRKDQDASRLNNILGVHFALPVQSNETAYQNTQDPESFTNLMVDLPGSENFDFAHFFIANNPWNGLAADF